MDAWTFIWLMFLLKIPIVALFLIVRWAVRADPGDRARSRTAASGRGRGRPIRTTRARDCPRRPRRGPHGEPAPRRRPRPRVRAVAPAQLASPARLTAPARDRAAIAGAGRVP